jgi:hypothetical protein
VLYSLVFYVGAAVMVGFGITWTQCAPGARRRAGNYTSRRISSLCADSPDAVNYVGVDGPTASNVPISGRSAPVIFEICNPLISLYQISLN